MKARNIPSDTRPHKRADPLGWPFGAIDPRELRRLLKQPKPVYPPAPF